MKVRFQICEAQGEVEWTVHMTTDREGSTVPCFNRHEHYDLPEWMVEVPAHIAERITTMAMKRDLMFCSLGNGLTVCDRLHEKHGDYEQVAHIGHNRQVTYYVQLDQEYRDCIENVARTDNSSASTSQPECKIFSTPPQGDSMQAGDILTNQQADYVGELEKLWDMLSDAIEGGRLSPADIPDDYDAFVNQMVSCNLALEVTKMETP